MKNNYYNFKSFILLFISILSINQSLQAKNDRQDTGPILKPWETNAKHGQMKEVTSKRNQFAKHFINPNGSITMFTSPSSQHYKVGNIWKDIDLTIKNSNNQDYPYYNDDNKFKTYYPSDITTHAIITNLADGQMEETITSVYIADANGNMLKEFNPSSSQDLNVHNGSISYSNVYPNTSIRYTQQNDGRKFDFVLQNKQNLTNLPISAKYFVIKEKLVLPNNWSIATTANGIDIFANSTWVANLPTPVAMETQSTNKKYNVENDLMTNGSINFSKNGGEVILTSKFPVSWLLNKDRNYPVNLDPVINYYPQNIANSTGYQTSATGKSSGYIRITSTTANLGWASFDITTLPSGATIASANYWGYHYTTVGDKYANIVGLQTVLPIPAATTGSMLNTQILTGPNYNNNYLFGSATLNTWRVGAIGGAGLTNIAGDVAQGATGLGFSYASGLTTFQYQYGYTGTNIPYLEINYSTAPCVAPPVAGTSTVNPTGSVCSGASVNLNLTGNSSGSGMTFFWESSANLVGPYTAISSTLIGPGFTTPVATTSYFRCGVVCSLDTQYSSPVMVTVPPLFPGGTYTINSAIATGGSNFQSFTAAVNAISCGIAGPIVFNVVPGSGPYTEQVVIPAVATFSATNTVTFNGNNETLTSALGPTTLELNGADFIKINNLIINNTNASTAFAAHLWNDANNNKFDGCTFTVPIANTASTSVPFSISGSQTVATTAGPSGSNDSVVNCIAFGGYYSISFAGNSAALNTGNYIYNNTCSEFYLNSIYNLYQSGSVIKHNLIQRPTRTAVTSTYGIYLSTGCVGVLIDANEIRNLFGGITTSTSLCYPIYVIIDGTLGNENVITNNLIHSIVHEGVLYPIYASGADYIKIYHNTIDINHPTSTATAATHGIYSSGTTGGIDIKNNIVTIKRGGTGARYCLYYTFAGTLSNNNVLLNTSAASATSGIGFYSTAQISMANWQAVNGAIWDQQSIEIDPVYNNPLSPTFDFTPTTSTVNNIGAPVGVTNDINNAVRSVLTPDPGAIEFTLSAIDVAATAMTAPNAGGCYTSTESVIVTVQNAGSSSLDFSITPLTVGALVTGAATATLTTIVNTGTLAPNATTSITIPTTVNMTTYGNYTFKPFVNLAGDANITNDTLAPITRNSNLIPGTVSSTMDTICVSGSPVLTLAGAYGGTIQWQSSTVSSTGPWTNVGSNSSTYTPAGVVSVSTSYRALVTCNTSIDSSNVLNVFVNNPSLLSTGLDSVCENNTASLTATANPGNNVKWYDVATGGTALYTGSPFITPALTSTTTYYAEAASGGGGAPTQIPMPGHGSVYTSTQARGMWFEAPTNFTISGLKVPDVVGTGDQNFVVVKFAATPAIFSATSTVTILYSSYNNPTVGIVPVNIPIVAGDIIGIFGTRNSASNSMSYASPVGPYSSTIAGFPVTLTRLIYQGGILSTFNASSLVSQEVSAAVGRTEVYYTTGCSGTRVPVEAFVYPSPVVTASPSSVAICTGAQTTLSGGGTSGVTYTWSGGITDATPFTVSSSTIYTVTGTAANNCTATATASIIANPVLTGTISASPTNICLGGNSSITATVNTLCLGSVSTFAGLYAPANWSITQSNSNGLVNTGGAPASIIMTTGTNGSFLEGTTSFSKVMTCSGTVSFNWSFTTPDIAFSDRPRYQINNGLSQEVTGFSIAGASSQSGTQTISVNAGDTVKLQAWTFDNDGFAATITYSNFSAPAAAITGTVSIWDAATGGTNLGTPPYTAAPASAGPATYYAEYTTNGTGCANLMRDPVSVTVNALPTVTVSPAIQTVCANAMATVTGGGASTYTWSGGITDATPFAVTSSATYTVTGTDANLCSNTATAVVNMNASPIVSGINATPSSICLGSSSTLSIVNPCVTQTGFAAAYAPANWTTIQTNSNGTVNTAGAPSNIVMTSSNGLSGSGTTDYSITIPSTCSGNVTFNWSYTTIDGAQWDYPQYQLNAGATSVFPGFNTAGGTTQSGTASIAVAGGDILHLKAYSVDNTGGSCTITISNFTAPSIAQSPVWSGSATIANPTASSTGVTPGSAGNLTYTVTVTDATGCTGTASTALTVNALPTVTASPATQAICQNANATVTGGGASTYAWTGGISDATPFAVTSSATYTVTGTDANLCTNTATAVVNVNALPTVTASPTTQTLCQNANATVTGGGASTYTWSGGITDATPFAVTSSATYTVTGTDANLCTNTATAVVNMNAAPTVTAGATPTTTCNNTVVTPTGSGASTYTWSGGLTDNTPFVATATATYTVTGTDGIGCSATSSVTVTVTPASGTLAPATSNQSQAHNDDFNVNYSDASCNLIATVDDGAGGNILGLTTATVNVDATAGVHNGQPFVRRWYQITPTSNGSADVILYINQADFNDYNASVTAPYLPLPTSGNNADPNIANIRITKNADAGLGNSPVVITPTVNWNGTYWELSFNTPSFSQFRIHSANPGNIPLPATITKFNGRKLSTSDMLTWTTASEQNNAYFNLQYATDGINFKTIAKVNSQAANGNSSSILNYSYEHMTPSLGHNYYRLEQVDIDNHATLNQQIVDLIWGSNGSTVSIYPNPTKDVLNIDLYTSKVQNTTVKVLDMSGRIIKQIQARSEAGMNQLSISLGDIASGIYTVQIFENDQLTQVSKVKKND